MNEGRLIKFSIPIKARPNLTPSYFVRKGRVQVYMAPKNRRYKEVVSLHLSDGMKSRELSLLSGPLCVKVCYHLRRPASRSAKKFPFPMFRPDLDNYNKLLLDAANGVVYHDDAQIVDLHSHKRYCDANSYITLEVHQIGT